MHVKPRFSDTFFYAAGFAACLAVAGCNTAYQPGTTYQPGEGTGVSASGTAYLARIRATYGLPPLTRDPVLESAARQQANYMARSRRMAHNTGYGRDFHSRMRQNGIAWPAAENVARGDLDLGMLFATWMSSPGHRKNILDPRYTRFGLAYVREGNGPRRYWALVVSR